MLSVAVNFGAFYFNVYNYFCETTKLSLLSTFMKLVSKQGNLNLSFWMFRFYFKSPWELEFSYKYKVFLFLPKSLLMNFKTNKALLEFRKKINWFYFLTFFFLENIICRSFLRVKKISTDRNANGYRNIAFQISSTIRNRRKSNQLCSIWISTSIYFLLNNFLFIFINLLRYRFHFS